MKTKYDKIAKHIRRINELLGVVGPYAGNFTITIETLKVLHDVERNHDNNHAFTSNEVDHAVDRA